MSKRTGLILAALFAGAAVPIQLITLSFGYSQYLQGQPKPPQAIMVAHEFGLPYFQFVYVPALVALIVITLYCRKNYPDIFRRIVVGFGVGIFATFTLDAFRQMGVINGWLPGDSVVMFGKMLTVSKDFKVFYPTGLAIHLLNGADLGLFYAFVWGKRATTLSAIGFAILWLLIIEFFMMVGPPMAPIVGLFGVNFAWPQFFLITLVAHIAYGITLGVLVQHLLTDEDKGGLFQFMHKSTMDVSQG